MRKTRLGIFLLFLISCKSTSETKITPLNQVNVMPENGIIYALPRTTLTFTVEATLTETFPGPYAEYAEKYIGITDATVEESVKWQITDIKIDTYNDLDPEQYYVLEPSGKFNFDFLKLVQNGLIFPVNTKSKISNKNNFYSETDPGDEIVFADLSVKQYVGKEDVTYYKRVQRDSLFSKVPVIKKQYVEKSIEDKAEEAASFIFMIRQKRFELISGMADFYPEGKSLELAIRKIDQLEDEYLSLFIGKKFTTTYKSDFEFTPTESDLNQPYILFRFSNEKGVLPANDLRGRPFIIEMEKLNKTKNLSFQINDLNKVEKEYQNKLYYRFPDQAVIKVIDGKKTLATAKLNVEQFGVIVSIPSVFLMEEERFIEFYRVEK
ncbi:MAG: hypothetical protein A2041_02320 [Bacteroidetes bacterium GWA2_31_9b]|nr:MAG: hypothetical protein A2041_02320 [Bacteroidetes bacterium GWA2_31_9b]